LILTPLAFAIKFSSYCFFHSDPTTKLFNLFTTNSKITPSTDAKRTINEHNNQTNSSFIDNDNPFLHAPFHHSQTHKQVPLPSLPPTSSSSSSSTNVDTITTANTSSFDPTSIVVGKRLSAFAPYQRQESNSGNNGKFIFQVIIEIKIFFSSFLVVDTATSLAYNFDVLKQKIPHSESYPPGINSNPNNQSKDVFINAPFKTKITIKQQNSTTTNKINAISPSSSHSTSSSNSQLIDFTVPSQPIIDSTLRSSSPSRRPSGSAGLVASFSTINTTNDTYYFKSEHVNNDGHSSSEELTSSSSSRKRHNKKKSSLNSGNESQQEQHAYANLSFNDAVVDEFF
jgi:hypothetical protein